MTEPIPTVAIPLAWLRDPELSHRDLGVLARLLTFDPSHSLKVDELVDMSASGRETTRAAIARLIDLGYIATKQHYSSGRRRGTVYAIRPVEPDPIA